MNPRIHLFVLILILGGHAVGIADVRLLHQPARFPGDFQTTLSYVTESSSGYRGFDDFRVLGGGDITNVRWQGFLPDGSTSPSPDVASWAISFSKDANGSPGDLLYETTLDGPALSTNLRDTTSYGGRTVSVYDYSVALPVAFSAIADERYWLSISVASDDRWMWMSGYGDDDQMLRTSARSGRSTPVNHDAYFELWGNRLGDLPSSGQVVANLSHVDSAMQDFLQANTIESALVGIMRNGEFVFQRGYGWRDEPHQAELPQDAMMRLASITKPITAATIRRLASEGILNLRNRVFDLGQPDGGILTIEPFGRLGDQRLKDVTVQDLLRHRGGWDRSIAPDYAFWDLEIARQMGLLSPPGAENKASYILGQPLQHDPGSEYAYSNIGYMLLGLVIEQVTGKEYADVVYEKVFAPMGVPRSEIEVGRTRPENRNQREPWYDQPARWYATNVYDPDGPVVPWPDGGWDHEAAESYGGLIASSKALLKFADQYRLWGDSIGSLRSQNEPPDSFWSHSGSLPGTNTILVQRGDGTDFVILLNRRGIGGTEYVSEIGTELFNFVSNADLNWPTALEFAGDGNGDGWVTTDDVSFFSEAIVLSAGQFALEFPDGLYRAMDFTGDGIVDRNDLPMFHQELIDNHNTEEQLSLAFVNGDVSRDWRIDHFDVDLLVQSLARGTIVDDVDGIAGTTSNDLDVLVKDVFRTWYGDANLDLKFNSSDMVQVFAGGKYETGEEAGWAEGDWDASGFFDSSDMVTAFLDGGYAQGLRTDAAVPEPGGCSLLVTSLLACLLVGRTRRAV